MRIWHSRAAAATCCHYWVAVKCSGRSNHWGLLGRVVLDNGSLREWGIAKILYCFLPNSHEAKDFCGMHGDAESADDPRKKARREHEGQQATGTGRSFEIQFAVEILGDDDSHNVERKCNTCFVVQGGPGLE